VRANPGLKDATPLGLRVGAGPKFFYGFGHFNEFMQAARMLAASILYSR
jgi:hypothetical protein